MNLTTLVRSRPELTNLSTYFHLHPDIAQLVLEGRSRTFLAPSDEAFANNAPQDDALGISLNIIDVEDTSIVALFKYHTLPTVLRSADFANGPHIVPTILLDPAYTRLSSGQVVVGTGIPGHQPSLTSGLQRVSNIVVPDLEYDGGILHIVDNFLTIPPSVVEVLGPLGLTAAEGALTTATNLGSELQNTTLTLFVPNNAAFEAVGSLFGALSTTQLHEVLGYHVVPAVVQYFGPQTNVSLPTLIGKDLHVVARDARVFVNSAEAVMYNVLVAEGVIHIIDNVLDPNNTTAMPDYAATSQAPAFSAATPLPGGIVPFTSGPSTPTSGWGLSTGAKVGIGIGVALGVVITLALVVYGLLRWKRPQVSLSDEAGFEHARKAVDHVPMKYVSRKLEIDERRVSAQSAERQDLARRKSEGRG